MVEKKRLIYDERQKRVNNIASWQQNNLPDVGSKLKSLKWKTEAHRNGCPSNIVF